MTPSESVTSIITIKKTIDNQFILKYIKAGDSHVKEFAFTFDRGKDDKDRHRLAIERARQFCSKVSWRFVRVEKFSVDLDELERRLMNTEDI